MGWPLSAAVKVRRALAFFVLVAVLSGYTPPDPYIGPSVSTPTAEIRGTVFNSTGARLANARVNTRPVKAGESPGTVFTDANGNFVVSSLVAGSYLLNVYQPGYPLTLSGNVNFAEFASVVAVADGEIVSGVNITLPLGGTISGTVTYSGGLVASERLARVVAYPYDSTTGASDGWTVQVRPDAAGNYTLGNLFPGEYIVRVEDWQSLGRVAYSYWQDADFWQDSTLVSVSGGVNTIGVDLDAVALTTDSTNVLRLAGDDRFETAIEISKFGFPTGGVPVIYIVNGLNFPDALSAGPAAAFQGGPVLLVSPTTLPDAVRAEIIRLNPEKIVVVGGTGSVSTSVFTQLEELAPVDRVGGADRYATSRAVVQYAFGAGAYNVYVVNGSTFPDALSAGSPAGQTGSPVLLVNNGTGYTLGRLDAPTSTLLADLGVKKVTIVGGFGVVNQELESDFEALSNLDSVVRYSGQDRYATSRAASVSSRPTDIVVLATGTNFPDALAGSWLAASLGAHIYLVPRTCIPAETSMLMMKTVILLGGEGSLSAGVESLNYCS